MSFKSSSGRETGKSIEVFRSNKEVLGQTVGGGGGAAAPTGPTFTASGGVIGEYTDPLGVDYTVHVFNTSGTFEVVSGVSTVDVLMVAGGGGGRAGAGGGGGLIDIPGYPIVPGSFPIVVGAGGALSSGSNNTFIGASRFLSDLTAVGGGQGGIVSPDAIPFNPGSPGGSGGGGGYRVNGSGVYQAPQPGGGGVQPSQPGASGPYGRGNPGAPAPGTTGGGGGGAGGVASSNNGGAGYTSIYTGISALFAGGGAGAAGSPGGGGGGAANSPGTQHSGGGGGGGGGPSGFTNGGSGTTIIRYSKPVTGSAKATGGLISYYGGKTIHAFLSSGTFTTPASFNETVEYVVVAGGGGGGSAPFPGAAAAGGGAGGYRTGTTPISGPSSTTIQIGAGSAVNYANVVGPSGTPSYFGAPITSAGGGGGGSPSATSGASGGSGGGSAGTSVSGGAGNTPPTSPPQGNPGGASSPNGYKGGGGGAGGAGIDGSPTAHGGGGLGVQLPATFQNPVVQNALGTPGPGSTYFWVAGGGGATSAAPGGGGGGGGNLSDYDATTNLGRQNTGGGGGAGYVTNQVGLRGGSGGSGIVLVAYPS